MVPDVARGGIMEVSGHRHNGPSRQAGDTDDQRPETPGQRTPEPPGHHRPELASQDPQSGGGEGDRPEAAGGQDRQLPPSSGPDGLVAPVVVKRTPLFAAQHADRYARQNLIKRYKDLTGANLIVMIDAIFARNMTFLEELLFDADPEMPLHLLLASPGGDGETAIRMVRSMQQRCTELTVIAPDMAKSAATLLCLGADHIVMGPNGDLGPVDPQFQFGGGLAGAKELVAAIDEAENRVRQAPDTFPLFANLLADVNMIMVQQARSAIDRSRALVEEALSCRTANQTNDEVRALAEQLEGPLIGESKSHSAVISAGYAQRLGLPVETVDLLSDQWRLLWNLWTRYYTLGCWPAGQTAVYEGERASHIQSP